MPKNAPKVAIVDRMNECFNLFIENSLTSMEDISLKHSFLNGAMAMYTIINEVVAEEEISLEKAMARIDKKMEDFASEDGIDLALIYDLGDEDSDGESDDEDEDDDDSEEDEFEDIDEDDDDD